MARLLGVARETVRDWLDATNGESANGCLLDSRQTLTKKSPAGAGQGQGRPSRDALGFRLSLFLERLYKLIAVVDDPLQILRLLSRGVGFDANRCAMVSEQIGKAPALLRLG